MRIVRNQRIGAALALIVGFAFAVICGTPNVRAQSQIADWEKAAGGKMSFEVASVKRDDPGQGPGRGYRSNFPLTLGSNFAQVGNLMSVDIPLRALIGFAFKLSAGQTHFLMSGLPDWVDSEWFSVEGRAPIANSSKDQFRLMVQSLLANRFKLAMHQEDRQLPMYALVLTKPGKTGPQLRPHVGACETQRPYVANPSAAASFSSFPCGSTVMGEIPDSIRARGGGQDVSLDYIAAFLTGTGVQGTAPDRPVINETGLTGDYDFWIEFMQEGDALPQGVQVDTNGPSFPEALRDELGLKLVAKTGPVDVLVVDHIEEPTPN